MEYHALFNSSSSELRTGVLEEMPPPEVKATVVGVGEWYYQLTRHICMLIIWTVSENKPVGPTVPVKDVSMSDAPQEDDVNPHSSRVRLLILSETKSQLHLYHRTVPRDHQYMGASEDLLSQIFGGGERERERENIYIFPWLQVRVTGPRHHLASSLRNHAQGIWEGI